ncbi:hypothetical protein QUB80_34080 [Chlorogloeopsis sp. ULAP01]|uniref:hypothetical protein n=1 Tax=Chlorogloeopsis sp. ULAP01 TaxID=3056483 RepID=UPI0025AAEAE4|nr:hypothetical protein [Chlorogloeopsis sp. ULAP01]MDM9385686.1 hypothetical protein [Chlorogloeopsis sp. ULAP01]
MEQLQLKTLDDRHPSEKLVTLDLTTLERRKESLEILLCQKVQRGEDTSQCMQALHFFRDKAVEQQLYKLQLQQKKEQATFNSLQRVVVTAFAILGLIAFFNGVFKVKGELQAATAHQELTKNSE